MESSSSTREEKDLFRVAMKGEWDGVVEIYEKYREARRARITNSGATALHVAVTEGKDEIVKKLVKVISAQNDKEALKVQNDGGYTVLHLAASVGNERLCKTITEANPSLIEIRTKNKETPLFSAAVHGKTEAFLYLDSIRVTNESLRQHPLSYWRREDGNTVLHAAIDGEHFELAYHIIHLYEDFVNYKNAEGFTPLHTLATKTSAFRSGSSYGRFKSFIYDCIYVEEIPPYRDLVDKKNSVKNVNNNRNEQERHATDVENPAGSNGADGMCPPNYVICVKFLKLFFKTMLVTFPMGKILLLLDMWKLKKKHKWSFKIMEELLNRSTIYDQLEGEVDSQGPQYDSHDDPKSEQEDLSDKKEKESKEILIEEDPEKESREILIEEDPETTNGTVLLTVAKHGVTEIVTKILDKFPTAIQDTDSAKKNIVMLAIEVIKKDPETTNGTVLLTAAKHGVTEIVTKILDKFPTAIQDTDSAKKNIVMLAIEYRQPSVYNLLRKKKMLRESIIRKVDREFNSVLHVAAKYEENKPWPIPGVAQQMQWEIKWFQFVKDSIGEDIFVRLNSKGKTPEEVFTETHQNLIEKSSKWLIKTSESCSVVAVLIAGVAFATSASIPGGNKEETGKPHFEKHPAFQTFYVSSLAALCSSVTALVMFLTIITSRFQEKDFLRDLPCKLSMGLTFLFFAIGCILVSFCAGHFLVLEDNLKFATFPVYALSCLPVSIFAAAQFPLYIDLLKSTLMNPFKHWYRYN